MNASAKAHLAKAKEYVERGEQFYRMAGEQIIAAQAADTTLSNREIGEWFGRSRDWVRQIVQWHTSGEDRAAPWAEDTPRRTQDAAKKVLREATPAQLTELMAELPAEKRAAVVRAAVPPPERTTRPATGTTFIELIVRISGALIELESLVAGWQNPAVVPPEFSRDSFSDIVAKVMRIQDHFDALADATDDEGEFMKIARNFRVTTDVR